MTANGFVFVDIETTGLEPVKNIILEVGFALYDLQLNPVDEWSSLVIDPEYEFFREYLCDTTEYEFIKNMHTQNGLLKELDNHLGDVVESELSPSAVSKEAIEVLQRWGVDRKEPMCGSSLRLDRNFLDVHMPDVSGLFSYRSIDASSDMERVRKLDPHFFNKAMEALNAEANNLDDTTHRVIGDMRNSARMLRVLNGMGL